MSAHRSKRGKSDSWDGSTQGREGGSARDHQHLMRPANDNPACNPWLPQILKAQLPMTPQITPRSRAAQVIARMGDAHPCRALYSLLRPAQVLMSCTGRRVCHSIFIRQCVQSMNSLHQNCSVTLRAERRTRHPWLRARPASPLGPCCKGTWFSNAEASLLWYESFRHHGVSPLIPRGCSNQALTLSGCNLLPVDI